MICFCFYFDEWKNGGKEMGRKICFMVLIGVFAAWNAAFVGNLTDNYDGTVTDNDTGLVWQQGQDDGLVTWISHALDACTELSLAGKGDWRLPNIKELESIVDDTRSSPAIDTTYFPSTNSDCYNSSTSPFGIGPNEDYRWLIDFTDGTVYRRTSTTSYYCYTRCVRGGI